MFPFTRENSMKAQVNVKDGKSTAILGSDVGGATESQKAALERAIEMFWALSVGDEFAVNGHPGSTPKNKIDGRVESKRVSVDLASGTNLYTINVK